MPVIILDRDGVINFESNEYIKTPDEWVAIPGSLEAIALLNHHGYQVAVATNQSGVGRGYYDIETLHAIHQKFMHELKKVGGCVDEIFFCPHTPEDNCDCRKPKPGLLLKVKNKYNIDLGQTYFIGDSYVDVQAARSAGCRPLLVLTGKGTETIEQYPALISTPSFEDLSQAVNYVLKHSLNDDVKNTEAMLCLKK